MLKIHVICGLHRSGTTYLGKVFSLVPDSMVFHEPFNVNYGLSQIPLWFPYLDKNSRCSEVEKIVDDAMNVRGIWLKPTNMGKSKFQGLRYNLIGGRQHMYWRILKLRNKLGILPSFVIWKDPFCTLMVDYLTRVKEMKAICLIRHPCAHYYSVKKQNWIFDIRNLTKQKELLKTFGEDIPIELWKMAEGDNLVSIALLWKIMSRVVSRSTIDNNRLMIVRHEDLCENPEPSIYSSCRHFGLQLTPKMRNYVRSTSEGKTPDGNGKRVHDFKRDSKALIHLWKDRLSCLEQQRILDIVGDDLNVFFPSL